MTTAQCASLKTNSENIGTKRHCSSKTRILVPCPNRLSQKDAHFLRSKNRMAFGGQKWRVRQAFKCAPRCLFDLSHVLSKCRSCVCVLSFLQWTIAQPLCRWLPCPFRAFAISIASLCIWNDPTQACCCLTSLPMSAMLESPQPERRPCWWCRGCSRR